MSDAPQHHIQALLAVPLRLHPPQEAALGAQQMAEPVEHDDE